MSATASTSALPITPYTTIEAAINGYRWEFSPFESRTINWSVSDSLWQHLPLKSAETQEDFAFIFSTISGYIGIDFRALGHFAANANGPGFQAAASAGSNINISFAYNGVTQGGQLLQDGRFSNVAATAFAYFPHAAYNNAAYSGAPGDVWLNWNNAYIQSLNFEIGTPGYALVMHEVLHALGLKHPHDSGGTGRPTYASLGARFADRQWVSVMSYDQFENLGDGFYSGSMPVTPMIMDVIGLQYLYGERPNNVGDTTHRLEDWIGGYYLTMWDSDGTDTIDATSVNAGIYADLASGSAFNGTGERTIGYVTTILDELGLELLGYNPSTFVWLWGTYERFRGTSYADVIFGGPDANYLSGGAGNDRLVGREGDDYFDWDSNLRGGADTLIGGPGNDVYVLDSIFDVVVEEGAEGVDTVFVEFSYTLDGSYVESLRAVDGLVFGATLTGSSWHNTIVGGNGSDTIRGLDGNDVLFGGAGGDLLDGGPGFDVASYRGTAAALSVNWPTGVVTQGLTSDAITGIEGLFGSEAADSIRAVNGVDRQRGETIRGGQGSDTIDGGSGVDMAEYVGVRAGYAVTRNGNQITVVDTNFVDGNEGTDSLFNVERLLFSDRLLAFGARAEEIARVAFVLWTPLIVGSGNLFSRGYSYYDNGGYDFTTMCGVALMFHQEQGLDYAQKLKNNMPGTTKTVEQIFATMNAAGGGEAGRVAALIEMTNDPATEAAIATSGVRVNGVVGDLFVPGFGELFGLLPGG